MNHATYTGTVSSTCPDVICPSIPASACEFPVMNHTTYTISGSATCPEVTYTCDANHVFPGATTTVKTFRCLTDDVGETAWNGNIEDCQPGK